MTNVMRILRPSLTNILEIKIFYRLGKFKRVQTLSWLRYGTIVNFYNKRVGQIVVRLGQTGFLITNILINYSIRVKITLSVFPIKHKMMNMLCR